MTRIQPHRHLGQGCDNLRPGRLEIQRNLGKNGKNVPATIFTIFTGCFFCR